MPSKYAALRASPIFAEEAFVVDVQSLLQTVMDEKGMTRKQLADAMGVSKARVSQLFGSEVKNFTIRLLARALHAMGEEAELTCSAYRAVEARRHMHVAVEAASKGENVYPCWQFTSSHAGRTELKKDCAVEVASSGSCEAQATVANAFRKFAEAQAA